MNKAYYSTEATLNGQKPSIWRRVDNGKPVAAIEVCREGREPISTWSDLEFVCLVDELIEASSLEGDECVRRERTKKKAFRMKGSGGRCRRGKDCYPPDEPKSDETDDRSETQKWFDGIRGRDEE